MGRLPALPSREVVKAFNKVGYQFSRQTGSHYILYHSMRRQTLSIPLHNPVKRGTLRSLIRQSGMTVDEFLQLL